MKKQAVRLGLFPLSIAATVVGLVAGCRAPEPGTPRRHPEPSAPGSRSPANASAPAFRIKPQVIPDGQGYRIRFSVLAPTDATVAVLSPGGKVVRHLASGKLEPHPPAPFQPGLEQDIRWDGRDDKGAPAPAGCRIAVWLGLRAQFARLLCEGPAGVASRGPIGIAVDRQGNLYVTEGSLFVGRVTTVVSMKVFDPDGNYLRTIIPFRADLPASQVSAVEYITTRDGRHIPLSIQHRHRPFAGFTPGHPGMTRHLPVITAAGRIVFGSRTAGRLLCVGTDGSCPREFYYGATLPMSGGTVFLALSPDERYLYVSGIGGAKAGPLHAVYRYAWDSPDASVKPFLGVEREPGTDAKHFNDPRGLAVDAAGRVYVGDYLNDRIQVFDAEGRFITSLPVRGPEQIQVHPRTGAVYVLSVQDRGARERYGKEVSWEVYADKALVKFASLEKWKEITRLALPKRKRHMHDAGPLMVLDASRAEPVLWVANVGRQEPDDLLWKVADRGDRLEKVAHHIVRLDRYQNVSPPLAADRWNNELYAFHTAHGSVRINPKNGEAKKLVLTGAAGQAALARVGAAAVGPDGLLYVRSAHPEEKAPYAWLIRRFNRRGECVPFEEAGEYIGTHGRRKVGSPEHAASLSVGPDGKLYVVAMKSRQDFTAGVDLYGAKGQLIRRGLIELTASPGGVRAGPTGRLYVSDTLRPKNKTFPDLYPADPRQQYTKWYGTVLCFPAEGGAVRPSETSAMTHFSRANAPVTVSGALWEFYGISPMPQQAGCLCVIADFDVDGWGRVFVPDVPGYCVTVLDANGNVLTRFGAYGNRDARGAGSAVPEPPIPIWFGERVAALDHDAFVVDSHNARIVQVHLTYAVREDVPLP